MATDTKRDYKMYYTLPACRVRIRKPRSSKLEKAVIAEIQIPRVVIENMLAKALNKPEHCYEIYKQNRDYLHEGK